ncbi:unnamed protein product [Cochlearia groenlandica]
MVDWSSLPEELLGLIFIRLFSAIELLRVRSICKSWRYAASFIDNNPFPDNPVIHLDPLVIAKDITTQGGAQQFYIPEGVKFLSSASFVRITPPSSSQSLLVKYEPRVQKYGKFRLLQPLSRLPLYYPCPSIDMSKFAISEIRRAYIMQINNKECFGFKRLVLGIKNRILGVGCDGMIRYWNGKIWTRIKNQRAQYCDIIVHKGITYALDSKGIIWWISSSLDIFRYGLALDENMINYRWKNRCLVECCKELYIVDSIIGRQGDTIFYDDNNVIRDDFGITECTQSERSYHPPAIGFKVYKMEIESRKWIEVKSLGDNAIVMATDTCFSISTQEFYGYVRNSIYFAEKYDSVDKVKVCNLNDGRISFLREYMGIYFQMFAPVFH